MIDRQARDEALVAVQRFLACETTNDEYETEYPLPELFGRKTFKDSAVKAIYGMSWNWFDDFKPHKLEGSYELDAETKKIANRCCRFLARNLEYEWRETNFITAGFGQPVLTTLGLVQNQTTVEERITHHLDQPEGDATVWPFFRRSDFEFQLNAILYRR